MSSHIIQLQKQSPRCPEASKEYAFASAADAAAYEASFGLSSSATEWLLENMRVVEHCEALSKKERSGDDDVLGPDPYADTEASSREMEKREAALRAMWEVVLDEEGQTYEWKLRPEFDHLEGDAINLAMRAPLELAQWDILDLGAGCGSFTSSALAVNSNLRVCSVEPLSQPREALKELQDSFPHAHTSVIEGSATRIPLPNGSAHCVIASNAFQWYSATNALFEVSRVLQRGGYLGVAWSRIDHEQSWARDASAVLDDWTGAHGLYPELDHTSDIWRDVFMNFLGGYYGPLHKMEFRDDVRTVKLRHLIDNALALGACPGGGRSRRFERARRWVGKCYARCQRHCAECVPR